MGILSTLLTVGGTALGFALGGPAGASLGASIGGEVGGAVDQSSASSKASKDQQAALQAAILARRQSAAQVGAINEPYLQAGYGATNALTGRLGLSNARVAASIPQTSPLAMGANLNALTGQPTTSAPSGQSPGYVMAGGGGSVSVPGPSTLKATGGVAVDPASAGPGYANADSFPQPSAPPSPQQGATNALTGQPVPGDQPAVGTPGLGNDPGTYGSTANPTAPAAYTSPGNFSYGLDDYKASPAYQWQLDQATKATLANASVTGALQSGAAMKALQDRAQNLAYTDFTNERAFNAGQFNTDRNFGLTAYDTNRSAYDDDRNYLTGRFDTETNNLFKLSGEGQTAAGVDSNAALGVGSGIAANEVGIGDAQAGNALQQGSIGSGLVTNLAGDAARVFGGTGGNALTPLNVQATTPGFTVATPGIAPGANLNFQAPIAYNFG